MMYRLEKRLAVFDNVTAIVFVVDISAYDEMVDIILDEGQNGLTSRLSIAFRSFQEMCASASMAKKSIIVILNQCALFEEKIQTKPFQHYFPNYTGGSDYPLAREHIETQFLSPNLSENRGIYLYSMRNDDDPNITRFIIATINDIILLQNLRNLGVFDDKTSEEEESAYAEIKTRET